MTKQEAAFRELFPHTRVTNRDGLVQVYAGDYLCSERATARDAFADALKFVRDGLINPDPGERSSGETIRFPVTVTEEVPEGRIVLKLRSETK